jgi:SNF2 family DNA or RNA helicase
LLEALRNHPELAWDGSDPGDRLVIFSERLETLHWLKRNLLDDLCLPENAVAVLHGGMSDTEQQRLVEDFGKENAPVRLLLASDVASEGINLHYLCHRLVHFDIPWSLMTFQQRNGRIDRYGQTKRLS